MRVISEANERRSGRRRRACSCDGELEGVKTERGKLLLLRDGCKSSLEALSKVAGCLDVVWVSLENIQVARVVGMFSANAMADLDGMRLEQLGSALGTGPRALTKENQ
ncbi:hypothetical protein Sjap_024458 [Stephania japonica]|uniref:Uncharacterized protein n=1 Tax=Stephania japonica TaxID=461633 RepID=A0AAP0EDE2_9MAGN